MPVFILSLMLIFLQIDMVLTIQMNWLNVTRQKKIPLFSKNYSKVPLDMLSNALDNPNKKWYAFGNIVLKFKQCKQKLGPGLAF